MINIERKEKNVVPEQPQEDVKVLADEELGIWQRKEYGRAKIGRKTEILFWALRVYVVLMMLLVGVQIWIGIKELGK